MHYRPDVDGLRAVSVTLVVLFHFGLSAIPGGFIGVDVFFVISGYLITGIILREIELGSFSLVSFYDRRIRRIFPALMVCVLATLAAGTVLLLPGDYEAAANSAFYAVLSASNFYFLHNTGYFDASAEMMPLLHTWSLAVEEQFYLAWPLLLWLLSWSLRGNRLRLTLSLVALAGASLAWSAHLVQTDPKSAFYLPHTRAWELAAGALIAVVPRGRWPKLPAVAHLGGLAGLALILFGSLTLTVESSFPGLNALFPVVGAVLLLSPWQATGLVQRALSTQPFVFVGKISYSLYLWHWPVLVLFRHYNLNEPFTTSEIAALATAMLALSYLSWRYIEQPARHARLPRRLNIGTGLTTATAIALVAMLIVRADGFPNRVPDKLDGLDSLEAMWHWDCEQSVTFVKLDGGNHCVLGAPWGTARVRGVLWGDSHALHFAPILDKPAREAGIAIMLYNRPCMPLIDGTIKRFFPDAPNYTQSCSTKQSDIINYVKDNEDISLFVLAASWSYYPTTLYIDESKRSREHGIDAMRIGFDRFVKAVSRPNLSLLVLSDVPARDIDHGTGCLVEQDSIILRRPCPKNMFKVPAAYVNALHHDTNDLVHSIPSKWPNVSVVMPHDAMCDPMGCSTVLDGEFLYRDTGHLRRNLTPETRGKLADLLGLRDALVRATTPWKSSY